MNNPLTEIAEQIAFHSLGIVPITNTWSDYNRYLASLPADEQRKMKRKFRKLWRKYSKKPARGASPNYVTQLGLGNPTPTKAQKRMRKVEVARRIRCDVVHPIKEKMMKSSETSQTDSIEYR